MFPRRNRKNDSWNGSTIHRKTGNFQAGILKNVNLWKEYRKAYEDMLENTSNRLAPWFVIPADDKWYTQLMLANIVVNELNKLDLSYPRLSDQQKKDLENSKKLLTGETDIPGQQYRRMNFLILLSERVPSAIFAFSSLSPVHPGYHKSVPG